MSTKDLADGEVSGDHDSQIFSWARGEQTPTMNNCILDLHDGMGESLTARHCLIYFVQVVVFDAHASLTYL